MKIATATYTGRSRYYSCRTRTDDYQFKRGKPTPIYDADQARELEGKTAIDVSYTPLGKLRAAAGGTADAVAEALGMGYQEKRSFADDIGVEFEGNPSGDELDEKIRDRVDELENRGDI